ncbi:hypothetical protein [Streptomyces sp. NPDC001536]|uniref:hypothetical protein n=1 Tax=Streptomyces sp. NPDC001536 TaxID=3364583 RepID=UPI00367F2782
MSADVSQAKNPSQRRGRAVASAVGLVLAAVSMAALVSCSTDSDGDDASSFSPTPTAADTESFSGSSPSALASIGASVKESAKEAASAAASSASARASAFEASVSADAVRANKAAQEELADVEGRGNATADVSMTGLPRAETGGLLALVVNIVNRTDETASYAVQVDFRDPDGKVVETRFVGVQDLEPGDRAQPLAVSRKPAEPKLTAEIAKAQRY